MASAPLFNQESETIFDRKVNLNETLQDVPKVPRWEHELGITGNYILVGDVNLWVEEAGQGPTLLLISGGPGTSHHYFHPHFLAAHNFCRVIYYDMRGVGLSDRTPTEPYSISQAVKDLENLRTAMNIEAWSLLGLSFGAAIAQEYTLKYPEHVQSIIFVGAFVPTSLDLGIGSRQRDYQTPEEIERIGQIYSVAGQPMAPAHSDLISPDLQAKMVYNGFLNGDWKRRHLHKLSEVELARYAQYEWIHDKNYYRQMLQDGLKMDLTEHFKNCPIPMLIFEGKWDLAYGSDKSKTMQILFPHAKIVVLENAGHVSFEDQPEAFFNHLQTYLANLKPIDRQAIRYWINSIKGIPTIKKE